MINNIYTERAINWNREHLFPQCWSLKGNPIRNDPCQIFATDIDINKLRGFRPFGEVAKATTILKGNKLGESITPGYKGIVFEPANEYKGIIARTLLLLHSKYKDQPNLWRSNPVTIGSQLRPWAHELMVYWSKKY